jgi:hypothetical protein
MIRSFAGVLERDCGGDRLVERSRTLDPEGDRDAGADLEAEADRVVERERGWAPAQPTRGGLLERDAEDEESSVAGVMASSSTSSRTSLVKLPFPLALPPLLDEWLLVLRCNGVLDLDAENVMVRGG